jgi:hypothetical protein
MNPISETSELAHGCRSIIFNRQNQLLPSESEPADEAEASSAGEQLAKE